MTDSRTSLAFVDSILHATDFSEASRPAFAYALALSLLRQTKLTLLHVGDEHLSVEGWTKFPPVRKTLEKWGLLEPGSPKSSIFDSFAVRVKKVGIQDRHPARAIVEYLEKDPFDMLVLGTEGREGLPRWLEPSVAESAAGRSATRTLIVPDGERGFISIETGQLFLRRVLVPVTRDTDSGDAIEMAVRAAQLGQVEGGAPVEIILLHVGSDTPIAPSPNPDMPYCTFVSESRDGDVVDEIIAEANDKQVELIVMATEGRNSLLDMIAGSTIQQVLRRTGCPLLAVPIGS